MLFSSLKKPDQSNLVSQQNGHNTGRRVYGGWGLCVCVCVWGGGGGGGLQRLNFISVCLPATLIYFGYKECVQFPLICSKI